jgi:hypothetical protein
MKKLFFTQKDLANELGRSRQYVRDMQAGGLEFPCYLTEVIGFLKKHKHPTRFRKKKG